MQTSTNSQANDEHLKSQLEKLENFVKEFDETEETWKLEISESKKGILYSQGLDILITCNQLVSEISELACRSSNQGVIKKAANVLNNYVKDRINPIKNNEDVISPEVFEKLTLSVQNILKAAGENNTDFKTSIKEHIDGINKELASLDKRCEEHTKQTDEMVKLAASLCGEATECLDITGEISQTLNRLLEQTLKIKEEKLHEVTCHLSSILDILFDHWKEIDNVKELAKQLADIFDKSIRSHIANQLEYGQSEELKRWSLCIYVIAALIQSFAGNNKLMFSYLDECVKNKYDLTCSDIDGIFSKFICKAKEALGKDFSTIKNNFIYPSALAKVSAYMLTKEGCRGTLNDIAKNLAINKECSAVYREELFGMQAILLHHQGDTKKAAEILRKECSAAQHSREEIADIMRKADELSKSETSTHAATSGSSSATTGASTSNSTSATTSAAASNSTSPTTSAAASNNTGATVSEPTKKEKDEQAKQWELRLASSLNLGHFFVTKEKPNPGPVDSNNSLGNRSP
jgi:hypothetical protein